MLSLRIYNIEYIPAWDKGLIRYFGMFHNLDSGSDLHFKEPEKISEGGNKNV